jgi:hypothetical protein
LVAKQKINRKIKGVPMGEERDVFISYSSEERDTVAKPLAELLISIGVSVWFDKYDLKVGDSLRR